VNVVAADTPEVWGVSASGLLIVSVWIGRAIWSHRATRILEREAGSELRRRHDEGSAHVSEPTVEEREQPRRRGGGVDA